MFNHYSEGNQDQFEMIVNYLGENYKKKHNEYIWQCPLCAEEGADRHCDNLKYNMNKGVLTCFRDPTHSKILRKKIFFPNAKSLSENLQYYDDNNFQTNTISDEKRIELIRKFYLYHNNFLREINGHRGIIQQLETMRGINIDTAMNSALGIKIMREDYSQGYGYMWAIPTFQYSTEKDSIAETIMGFEYRPADFSKSGLERETDCATGLAMINTYSEQTEVLIVLEGYLDCYAFMQYLRTLRQDEFYHIVTPSNGVNSLIKQIDEVDFPKYKKWILFLDNDSAGRKVTEIIKEKYPFFTDYKLPCGCKDFNEHLLKCIRQNKF